MHRAFSKAEQTSKAPLFRMNRLPTLEQLHSLRSRQCSWYQAKH